MRTYTKSMVNFCLNFKEGIREEPKSHCYTIPLFNKPCMVSYFVGKYSSKYKKKIKNKKVQFVNIPFYFFLIFVLNVF